jgi:glucokinase
MTRDAGSSIVLAADVGGTKTQFGLFRAAAGALEPLRVEVVPSDRTASFVEVLGRFLRPSDEPRPLAACLAAAGPVVAQRVTMTNHPWVLDAGELSAELAGVPVRIVNDLEATAVAMPHLPMSQLVAVAGPADPDRRGTIAVVAPGTGLGCASLYWDGRRHHPVASEGGHSDFAPRDDREIALWRFLHERHGHVSWERILSGHGIASLYTFLRDVEKLPESATVRGELAAATDPAAVVSHAAIDDGDPLSAAALDLFAGVLGAKAGNLALEVLALGGVFIAGGIPPKILPALTRGSLRAAFLDKGRHHALLERVALHVSLEPDAPLLGAARLASGTVNPPV